MELLIVQQGNKEYFKTLININQKYVKLHTKKVWYIEKNSNLAK
jgi:hypothetical protein